MVLPSVSVIIPVYNAVNFIEDAVNSTLFFSEVGEILLIEDGGRDGSFEKCKELEQRFNKIKILIHQGRINRGAAASRNLGIVKARYPYIAFLDADDYFLPNRFDGFKNLVKEAVDFDGIYEPIQYFNGSNKIYGIKTSISPHRLTHFLIRGTYGHFHTNGLIIKRQKLIEAGLFVESLDLHEDSDLWIKLSFYGKLISGEIEKPVSMVRKHEGNRIWEGTTNQSRCQQMIVTWNWAKNEKIGLMNKILILRKLLSFKFNSLFGQ